MITSIFEVTFIFYEAAGGEATVNKQWLMVNGEQTIGKGQRLNK